MNLVGKIFVFLIMVMSVCFAMLAVSVYMAHTNWRERVVNPETGLKALLKKAQAETDVQKQKIVEVTNKYKAEVATKQQAMIKSETAKVLLAEENKQLHKDIESQKTLMEGKLAAVQSSQQELNAEKAQNVILKDENKVARTKIDEQFKQILEMTEVNHGLSLGNKSLEERKDQLTAKLAHAKLLLGQKGLTLDSPLDRDPVVEGVITGVRVDGRDILVQLSIGADDGLYVGNTLQIFRGSQYLGRVRVTDTEPDKSAGRVEKPLGQIQIRDKVQSKRSMEQAVGSRG